MTRHRRRALGRWPCGLALAALTSAPVRTARAQTEDPWWGRDRALHFGVAASLSGGGYALSALVFSHPGERALAGAAVAGGESVAKELWDLSGHGDPSWRDLAWDGIGTAAGIGVALALDLWVFRRSDNPHAARSTPLVVYF
jgi:putative lipoprotein